MTQLDDLLDDLFHGCALVAFLEVARTTGWPPPPEATRALAYELYEDALAIKNGSRPRRQPAANP